jgi:hypothetical protein
MATALRKISMAEVAKHNTQESCWMVIRGLVYDMTAFMADHPGGSKPLVANAGKDATRTFEMLHNADKVLKKYGPQFVIGELGEAKAAPAAAAKPEAAAAAYRPDTAGLQGSTTESWNSGGTAGMLDQERRTASFDVLSLTHVLNGGKWGKKKKNKEEQEERIKKSQRKCIEGRVHCHY